MFASVSAAAVLPHSFNVVDFTAGAAGFSGGARLARPQCAYGLPRCHAEAEPGMVGCVHHNLVAAAVAHDFTLAA